MASSLSLRHQNAVRFYLNNPTTNPTNDSNPTNYSNQSTNLNTLKNIYQNTDEIADSIYLNNKKHLYMFSFGSNCFDQVCERFNILDQKQKVIWDHTYAGQARHYIRSFFNTSQRWGGAVATLAHRPTKNWSVFGLLIPVPEESIPIMDRREGPKYQKITIPVINHNHPQKQTIQAFAYVAKPDAIDNSRWQPVSKAYLIAIALLLKDYREKRGLEQGFDKTDPYYQIDIHRIYESGLISKKENTPVALIDLDQNNPGSSMVIPHPNGPQRNNSWISQ